jgi:hypothetical protein
VHVHIQRLVSVVKIAIVLEEYTTEEKNSVMLWLQDSMQRIFIKKCFQFKVGSICRIKRFTAGSRNSVMDIRKLQIIKWRCGSD